MEDLDGQRAASQLISILKNVKSTYEQNIKEITYLEREYLDINHAIELFKFNAYEGYLLSKQLQDNRIKRRKAKDQNQQLEPLYDLITKNKNLIRDLNKTQGEIHKIKMAHQQRNYKVRARTDLQEAFNKANERKGSK